jgi:hypothetical protein
MITFYVRYSLHLPIERAMPSAVTDSSTYIGLCSYECRRFIIIFACCVHNLSLYTEDHPELSTHSILQNNRDYKIYLVTLCANQLLLGTGTAGVMSRPTCKGLRALGCLRLCALGNEVQTAARRKQCTARSGVHTRHVQAVAPVFWQAARLLRLPV